MATKTSKGAAAAPSTGTFRKVLAHDEKPNFWKPTRFGEKLIGKLIAVTKGSNGKVLQILLFSGVMQQVGVSTQLAKVPWESFVEKDIAITYQASVKTKFPQDAKLFDVEVAD